jgi:hypothetical protein
VPNQSKRNNESKKRPDPTVIVALIGLAGTIIAALLASPLLEKWFPPQPAETATLTSTPTEPSSSSSGSTSTASLPVGSKPIRLNETVTGTLYFDEAGVWIFSDGPAAVTIILDVSEFGSALIILRDPSGVERAYVDEQSLGVARLVNFSIPTDGDYSILVRNTQNTQVNYTLTVQDAATPPPP